MTSQIEKILRNALAEDIADGDITTAATVSAGVKGYAEFLVKKNGVIAGLETAEKVFHLVDPELELKKFVNEGDKVESG